MKILGVFFAAAVLCLGISAAGAQEYGKVRALQERAAYVTKQKNDFIVKVLSAYQIAHEVNDQGAVVRINMDGKWLSVSAIEIVPVLQEGENKSRQVAAHELYFFTSDGILNVMSALTIR